MGEHDVFGDGEAEAGASGFAGAGFVDPIEAFKETGKMFEGDAGAKILDEEFDGMRDGMSTENDAAAGVTLLRTVFQGIVDQVGKDLVDGFAIGENRGEFLDG